MEDFINQSYHLAVHGPNGFYQEYKGDQQDPQLLINISYDAATAKVLVHLDNTSDRDLAIQVDNRYANKDLKNISIKKNSQVSLSYATEASFQWYDLYITAKGYPNYGRCYAGHLENGKNTMTDPRMGKSLA